MLMFSPKTTHTLTHTMNFPDEAEEHWKNVTLVILTASVI